jgi:3-hydroxyacyl-[acyl-carrier-protein] dehydratase
LTKIKLPALAIDLVPHRNRMLLINSLDEFSKDSGRGHLNISDKNLFIKNNRQLDSIVYVELLAQLIAAHSGYESKLEASEPKVGFLVGLKDLEIHQSVSAGNMVDMRIKKDYEFDQITYVKGKILYNSGIIAEGTLKLWEQPGSDFQPELSNIDNQPIKKYQITDQTASKIVNGMELSRAIVDNLYELNFTEDQSSVEAKLYFSDEFIGFDGHFPGSPLLPGILMMKTGLLISEIALEKSINVKKIKNAKFARSIFPRQEVNLKIDFKNKDDLLQLSAVLSHKNEVCAKYSIMIKVEQ